MARREVETSVYIAFAKRIIRRAGERVAQADDWDLAELASVYDDLGDAVATAVAGLRAQGHSWQYIGDALGISRQAAQQRFAEKVSA
ncbi:hypothetical protein [Microbacterium schleiferi]|uniref:Helix-turn-helix domain-containing protein n=1 Tax=Microbacterium schleiferi TaxID=69362 RepID=A0ABU7V7J1_9MICO